MANVYNTVKGMKGGMVAHRIPDRKGGTRTKLSVANSIQRFAAMQPEVQRALIKHGAPAAQRAHFRLAAEQQAHAMMLREKVAEAIKGGDPEKIKLAQAKLDDYRINHTTMHAGLADVDYIIAFARGKGDANYAGNEIGMSRRREILQQSLTR